MFVSAVWVGGIVGAYLFPSDCLGAVIPFNRTSQISVLGISGVGTTAPEYHDRIDVAAPLVPFDARLSRSAEAVHDGQVVARMAGTAEQASSLDIQPLRLAAAVDGLASYSGSRTAAHPGPGPTSTSAVSDFDLFFDVTDLPAQYVASGALYGTASAELSTGTDFAQRVFRVEGAINPQTPVAADGAGVLAPGRYRFRVNVGGGAGGLSPFSYDNTARAEDIALIVSQVPEPSAAVAVVTLLPAALLARRRRRQ